MSLGIFKKISKSSANKQFHSYENVQATNVRSHEKKGKKKQHRNHKEDYINVQFEDRNGRRHLAVLGETRQQSKQSGIDTSAGAIVSSTESIDGTMPQHELAKSNSQELKQSTGSKSWRVYTRADSDSSSSDITNRSESPDAKKRELEHYNRLKLNLSCLPRNKKALKGIKTLTNAKQQQPSLQVALHTSELFKQRQQLSIPDEPRDTSTTAEDNKKTIKYKKEGHINHLLSVTGRPIRHSTSFVSSFSRTVSDIHGVHPQDNNFHKKTGEIHVSMRDVGKPSNSFSDSESVRATIQESSQFSKTTSLTRTHSPLICHTDVRCMYEHFSTDSNDTLNAAWNDACLATCRYTSVPFIDKVETITFTHSGRQYISESHDIRITIPKGAIQQHTIVHLQVGVALHGPFSFPDAKQPVSPIIWIGVTPTVNLKIPIEITVPHFVKASSQSSHEKLEFLKAASKIKSTSKYHFSKVAEINQQFNSENYGTVSIKDFCFYCIVGDASSNSTLTANYGLVPVIPKPVAQTTMWKIHYYVIYLLKTYIHVSDNIQSTSEL